MYVYEYMYMYASRLEPSAQDINLKTDRNKSFFFPSPTDLAFSSDRNIYASY